MLEPNPRLLDCCHSTTFENHQYKLARPVNNHISNINGLGMCIQHSGDVVELEKFFVSG